jgi:acetyltransferase-like isoleucine patch superfamily enzyme
MNPLRTLRYLAALRPSRRRQWLALQRDRFVTAMWYKRQLRACGEGTIVQKPLFWTPEFVELGAQVLIWAGSRIEAVDEYGGVHYQPNIRLGNDVSLQQACHITAAGTLTIGDDTTILYGVLITDIDHGYEALGVNVRKQAIIVQPTHIGRNCFLGAGSRILAGTHLGDHCIVGTNAVVRGVFPDHCVLAGIPARIVKRFDPDTGTWRKTNSEGRFL